MFKKLDMQNVNQLKVGSLLTYLNLIISSIIPLLYTPIMLRILGQAEYGLYSLSNSVIGYLSLLTLGLGGAVGRYIIKYRVENNRDMIERMTGLFLTIFLFLAIIVCVVGFTLPHFTGIFFGKGLADSEVARLNILLVIMTVSTAVSFPSSVYSAIIIAYEKYIFRKVLDCFGTLAAPIFNLVVLFLGYATVGMACVGLGLQIVTFAIIFRYCWKVLKIKTKLKQLPFYMLKEIGGFSIFIFIGTIVDMLYWATDKVLIGAMLGTVAVAVYNIGGTFNGIMNGLSSAISNVFGTRVNTIFFSNQPIECLSELLIRVGRIQYLIVSLFLSGFVVFGQTFILFWAGEGYLMAYYVALMTLFPVAIPLIQNIAYSTIVAQNKHRFRAIVYLVIAIINVISTFLVIPYFGILGAAACTCISFLVGNGLIMNIYYYKVTKLDVLGFWKNILRMSVVPVVLCVCFILIFKYVFAIQSLVQLIIMAFVFVAIFAALSWKFTMNSYEKDLIMGLVHRKRK